MKNETMLRGTIGIIGEVLVIIGLNLPTLPTLSKLSLLEFNGIKLGLVALGAIALGSAFIAGGNRLRAIGINTLVFGLTAILCFGAVELILFATKPPVYPPYGAPDDILHHRLVPNVQTRFVTRYWDVSVRTNEHGLRDDPVGEKNRTRILVLGDSFTWGWGVEANETFTSVMERELSKKRAVEALNAGCGSYATILEYLYLKNDGLQLLPDIVLLNFDMSDVADNRQYERTAQFRNGELMAVTPQVPEYPFLVRLYRQSRTVRSIQNLLDQVYGFGFTKTELDTPWARSLDTNKLALLRNDVNQSDVDWNRTFRYLDQIHELAKANNITFAIATYPYGVQVSPRQWFAGRHHFGFGHEQVYSTKPMTLLRAYAESRGIPFYDATDRFRHQNEPLYFDMDGHFNVRGHAVYGEGLAEFMEGLLQD